MDISLREFLIETISHSGYGRQTLDDAQLVRTATSLGVLPETLLTACARRRERDLAEGRDPESGNFGGSYRYNSFALGISVEARHLWETYAKKRGIHHSTLGRSLIHSYLQSTREPEFKGKSWTINGILYRGTDAYTKMNITHAAKLVLQVRAQAQRVSMSDVVRSLIIETIEGKAGRPGTFDTVSASQMFTDPSHYWAPTAAGESRSIDFQGQAPRERLVESLEHEQRLPDAADQ